MDQVNVIIDGLKIVREFKAPKGLVFDAFGKKEAFAEWWAQPGTTITMKEFSFKPGGQAHYKMEGNQQIMWGLFKYGNIVKSELIEFVNSFSDEDANVCRPPFPMEFPHEIFNRLTFTEFKGRTTVTMEGHPVNATEAQLATYRTIAKNLEEGFEAIFNQLDAYLIKSSV